MNIIIVGCGKVGKKIAESLSKEQDHNITVVDISHDAVEALTNQFDIMGIIGNGADVETLYEADIKKADILIAVTGSDELNLLTCLLSKKLGNCQNIARIRKPEYSSSIKYIRDDLGLALVINPELESANEIARILNFPMAIQIDSFAKGRAEILKYKILENSVLAGMQVSEISSKLGCNILICGVEHSEGALIPDGNYTLKVGDCISIISTSKDLIEFFKKISVKTKGIKDAFIVGGGDIAYYLAQRLIQSGVKVKIIEKNPQRCDFLCQALPKATIICGDGTVTHTLMEEGIEQAESFISLINIDEENIMLSLFAKSVTTGKVITKINRIEYGNVVSQLDLGTVIYPKYATAENIVKLVRGKKNSIGSEIETMHYILEGKAEALEFNIREESSVTNIPLEKLNLKKNILIACINRNGKIIIPGGKDEIMVGDTVIVVTTNLGYKGINDILE